MVKLKLEIQEVGSLNSEVTEAFERSLYTFYDKNNAVADDGKYVPKCMYDCVIACVCV